MLIQTASWKQFTKIHQHCGGVVWSVLARLLPIVAKAPNFSLSCARCADTPPWSVALTNSVGPPPPSAHPIQPMKRTSTGKGHMAEWGQRPANAPQRSKHGGMLPGTYATAPPQLGETG